MITDDMNTSIIDNYWWYMYVLMFKDVVHRLVRLADFES